MKITDVAATRVPLPPQKIAPTWNSIVQQERSDGSRQRYGTRLEVRTDEGVTGCGLEADATVLGRLRDLLIGQDPLNAEACWDRMYAYNRKPVAKGEYISSIGKMDVALWDLRGKALGQPVWKLLGGHRNRLPIYGAGGYYGEGKGLKELAAEMEVIVDAGYRAVKMKVAWPGAGLKVDAERVRVVRETVGPDVDVMVDANNGWDFNEALRFARMIEKYEPYWFEEPIKPDDYRGQAALCAALDTPVASGENEFTRWGFRDLIEARAVDVVQADARTCGGITEWLKIAAFASAYHLPMAPHGNVYAGANCVAAVANGLIVEYRPRLEQDHSHDLYDPPTVEDGHITLSDEPGLGVPWREDLIKRLLRT
jgi:L-alanine-DL-glutamate epimerase-like enolase superfamily enzyme